MRCTSCSRNTRFFVAARSLFTAPASSPAPWQAALEPLAVLLGLQRPHHPGAHVGEALVVEVHRVLGGEHDAHPLRARLLEQGQQRPLGGRVRGVRREVAEDLVHVDERAQLGRPALAAHPGLDLVEQERRHEERAPRRRGARSRRSTSRGRPSGARSMRSTSSGSPSRQLSNDGEASRLLSAIISDWRSLRGNAVSRGSAPILSKGGSATAPIRPSRVRPFPARQLVLDQGGQEDGGRRLQRVGVDADEAEQARRRSPGSRRAGPPRRTSKGTAGAVERLQHVRGARPAREPGV